MKMTVKQILEKKGSKVHSIDCESTAFIAVEKMAKESIGSLIIMDGEKICGIVSERDYLRRVILKGLNTKETKLKDIMTKDVVCVEPQFSAEECLAIMTKVKCRHLPVMDRNKLSGIVSIGDVVKSMSQEKDTHIKHLTDYITGKYPA